MRRAVIAVWVVVLAVLGIVAYLFAVQNGLRTVMLSLDLGFAAWQLGKPVTVPALMRTCFALGFLVGGVILLPRTLALRRRVQKLERQVALSGGDDEPWG